MFSWFTLTSLLHRFAYKILYWSISNQLVIFIISFSLSVSYLYKTIYKLEQLIVRSAVLYNGTADHEELQGTQERLQVPGEIQQVVEVLTECLTLVSDCQVHPEISSQLISYLFYFINASLFNSLMERGTLPGFYQWSRGVRIRANLDLLLDWAHAAGLGELALEHTHTLSSAVNLLATPRKNLLQVKHTMLIFSSSSSSS
uniref:Dilute domain-containing protein n=1 Tax=Maylandia zebra TaxID=106582 RepID=A0A3P9B9I2_9CICH